MVACALTTVDNPYDPFEQFELWYRYDIDHGYNCCGYLARLAKTSNSFIDEENAIQIEKAIDMVLQYDPNSIYRKIKRDVSN